MTFAKIARASFACLPLLALALAGPRPAQACGGTFCDTGPTVMPVDQSGETIVFWIDDAGAEPFTEAHIQIQYEGDAERFAWIIPVMAVPEVLVGSQALFDNLLQATVPTFRTQTTTIGDCGFGGIGCGMIGADAANRTFAADDGGDEGGSGGPDILDRGYAGAFEYVTLTGDTVAEITDWLDMAGYAQDPEAPPILQEYLQEGFVFVAVKLRSGADVDEIHPLAIRYAGVEPCIPLRLTRIAAVEDMAVRAFFLGHKRVAPQNWPHVVLNHLRLDYANNPAGSYTELVSLAVDEAGGRAFITEYAGSSSLVATTGLHSPAWNPAAFAEIEPTAVVSTLADQGLIDCAGDECSFSNPQVEILLDSFLPPPAGVAAHTFWSCLSCYVEQIDLDVWDASAFATALAERVVTPGLHASEMLASSSYLTRLFTLISPHEMLEDPLFHETTGLGEVDNLIDATRVNDCDGGPTFMELPDGRRVALDDGGTMPDLDLPAAERIEQVPAMGPPQVEVDNGPAIDAALAAHNEAAVVGPTPGCAVGSARGARQGLRAEGLLTLLSVFGIAWAHRRRRTALS